MGREWVKPFQLFNALCVCVCVLFVQGSGHDIKTKFTLLAGVVFSIPYPWDVHHEPTDLNELFSNPGDMGVKKTAPAPPWDCWQGAWTQKKSKRCELSEARKWWRFDHVSQTFSPELRKTLRHSRGGDTCGAVHVLGDEKLWGWSLSCLKYMVCCWVFDGHRDISHERYHHLAAICLFDLSFSNLAKFILKVEFFRCSSPISKKQLVL